MKTKTFFTYVLTLCVLLFLLPAAAQAAGNEAKIIGGQEYETLSAAIAAANNGDIIMLQNNVTLTEKSAGYQTEFNIRGKDITLDLNGKTIKTAASSGSNYWLFYIHDGAKLTLKDSGTGGLIDIATTYGYAIVNCGTFVMDGGDIKTKYFGVAARPYYDADRDGIIDKYVSTTTTVNGGSITGYGSSWYSTTPLHSSATSDTTQTITINGGLIHSGLVDSSNKPTGNSIYLGGQYDKSDSIILTINGGKIYGYGTGEVIRQGNYTKIFVTSGEVKYLGSYNKTLFYVSSPCTTEITGGEFTADPSAYLPANRGFSATVIEGRWTVNSAVAKNGEITYGTIDTAISAAEQDNTVTLLKNVTGCDTTMAVEGKTITIDMNGYNISGQPCKTGTNTKHSFFLVDSGGKLTVLNSENSGGFIKVTEGADEEYRYRGIQVQCNNTAPAEATVGENVTIEAGMPGMVFGNGTADSAILNVHGTLKVSAPINETSAYAAIQGNGQAKYGGTQINIYDGAEIFNPYSHAIYHPQAGALNITGGDITGSSGIEVKSGSVTISVSGSPIIKATNSSSSYTPNSNGSSSEGYAVAVVENASYTGSAEVAIEGGYFTGPIVKLQDSTNSAYTFSLSITGGYFTADPKAYVPSTHQAGTSELTGYSYKVQKIVPAEDIPASVEVVAPVVPEPVVDLPGDVSEKDTNLANDAASAARETTVAPSSATALSNLAVGDVITDATTNQPKINIIGDDEVGDGHKPITEVLQAYSQDVLSLPSNNNATASDLTIVVQPYLDIKVTGATAGNSSGATAMLTFDITPMSQILITTQDAAQGTLNTTGTSANAVKVGEPQPIETATSWPPITIAIPLPIEFATSLIGSNATSATLLIKHDKGMGNVYYYDAQVTGDTTNGYKATFTVTNGFSAFTLLAADNRELTINYDSGGTGGPYRITNVGAALPTATRSGYTFNGWTIAGATGTYTHLTNELWNALMPSGGTDRTVNAVAQFTPISTGGGGGGGGAPTYTITADATDNGSVTLSRTSAASGTAITVTLKPDAGYGADTVTVKDAKDNEVDVTKNPDGTYTFTMPAANVTVTATFKAASTDAWANPFADVNTGDWFYGAVQYVNENGLMQGTGATAFEPYTTMSRAMLVTVLWRMEGEPAAAASDFTDLTQDWYRTAVNWAAGNGIVEGYSATEFGPDDTVTREQMAAVLYRYAQHKGYDVSATADLSSFVDADYVSAWATGAMTWAVGAKLIQGDGASLSPQDGAERAQVAAILQRFCENVVAK